MLHALQVPSLGVCCLWLELISLLIPCNVDRSSLQHSRLNPVRYRVANITIIGAGIMYIDIIHFTLWEWMDIFYLLYKCWLERKCLLAIRLITVAEFFFLIFHPFLIFVVVFVGCCCCCLCYCCASLLKARLLKMAASLSLFWALYSRSEKVTISVPPFPLVNLVPSRRESIHLSIRVASSGFSPL